MREIKHYLRHEDKVNENKVISYGEALRCETTIKKYFMSNLKTYYYSKLDFKKRNNI